MNCPDELILAQYVDSALSAADAGQILSHIESCPVCTERMEALALENRILLTSFQSADDWDTIPGTSVLRSMSTIAALLLLSVILRLGIDFAAGIEPAPALKWLFPFTLSGQLTWLSNGLFYLLENGGSIMSPIIFSAMYLAAASLLLVLMFTVARRLRRTAVVIGLSAVAFFVAIPSYAIEVRRADKGGVAVASNETVDDTLVVFADSATVSGTVNGDLVAFARQVNVQGTVTGNVIGFAQRVDVTGDVQGDVIGFGQSVQTSGKIGRNLWAFGQSLTIARGGRAAENATLFGANINIDGEVGRDLAGFAGTMDVGSRIGRDLHFSGAQFNARPPAEIGRNLSIKTESEKSLQIDPGVIVHGNRKITFHEPGPSRYMTLSFYVGQLLRLGAAFLTGMVLFWLFPSTRTISLATGRDILVSGGIGFLIAVALPVAALIAAITVIGLPIGITAFVLWVLGLYLAKIIVARKIGTAVLGAEEDGLSSRALVLLLGLFIVIVAVNIPFIGGILNFLLMLIGFGALVLLVYRRIATEHTN